MASAERPVFFQGGTKDSHLAFSSGKSRENRGAGAVHDGLSERDHEFESGFLQRGGWREPLSGARPIEDRRDSAKSRIGRLTPTRIRRKPIT